MHDSYKIQWKQNVMARKCNTCGSTNFIEIIPSTNFLENTIVTMGYWYNGPVSRAAIQGRSALALDPARYHHNSKAFNHSDVIGNLNQMLICKSLTT